MQLEIEYTESDYEQCTDERSYVTKMRTIVSEDYPELSSTQLDTLLKSYWPHFRQSNPKLAKANGTVVFLVSAFLVKNVRLLQWLVF